MKNLFLLSLTALFIMSCGNSKKEESTQTDVENTTVQAPVPNNHIVIKAGDNMRFDKTEFTVKAGEEVTLILMNTGEMSKEAMGHNFILLKPGSDASSFANSAASTKATDYFPKDLEAQVIAHTKLLGGRENDQIKFTLTEGTYDFLCSFPGHFATMNGKITAVK
jgi:azurin